MNNEQNKPAQAGQVEHRVMLPCPFCGKSDSLTLIHTGYPGEKKVVCNYNEGGCGGSTGAGDSDFEAIKNWNRRAA